MFKIITKLCDRLDRGEISPETFCRLLDAYEDHVRFLLDQPTTINEMGEVFKHVDFGPGTKVLKVG